MRVHAAEADLALPTGEARAQDAFVPSLAFPELVLRPKATGWQPPEQPPVKPTPDPEPAPVQAELLVLAHSVVGAIVKATTQLLIEQVDGAQPQGAQSQARGHAHTVAVQLSAASETSASASVSLVVAGLGSFAVSIALNGRTLELRTEVSNRRAAEAWQRGEPELAAALAKQGLSLQKSELVITRKRRELAQRLPFGPKHMENHDAG